MSGENERCSLQIRARQRFTESIDGRRRGPADLGGPIVEVNVDVDAWLGCSRSRDLLALAGGKRMSRTISQRIEELLVGAGIVHWRQGKAAGRYRGQSLNDLLLGERVRSRGGTTAGEEHGQGSHRHSSAALGHTALGHSASFRHLSLSVQ